MHWQPFFLKPSDDVARSSLAIVNICRTVRESEEYQIRI